MKEWLRTIWSRAWAVARKERLDREFDEELSTHLELLVDEGRGRGLSHADAQREALRKLGRPAALRELHREQRGMPVLDVLAQDLRYSIRILSKSPAFACMATLSLALGIGANTALFSLVDGLLLRSLPVREPDRLVQVQQRLTGSAKNPIDSFPKPVFDLGVTPVVGRMPERSDGAVVILSYHLWRDRFSGSASVLGRLLIIDGQACSVIGVAPQQFFGLSIDDSVDLWMSSRTDASQQMMARLKPGVTAAQARAATQVLFHQLAESQPEIVPDVATQIELLPAGQGLSQLRAQYERPLLALTVLVTLVFFITCTNVGNLLLVRNAARRREFTVRAALGARRSRLILQILVESVILAALE